MSLYVDASLLVPTIVLESTTETVAAFLAGCGDELIVSELAAAEAALALSRLIRMGELSNSDAAARLADFDTWRSGATETADLEAHDCRLANTYVRRFELKLRAPDALHTAICHRLGLQLVTLNRATCNGGAGTGRSCGCSRGLIGGIRQ